MRPPDLALFRRFQDAVEGVAVSLGHSLATSPADVAPCLAAGAQAFTHLGNGIPNEVNRHDNALKLIGRT